MHQLWLRTYNKCADCCNLELQRHELGEEETETYNKGRGSGLKRWISRHPPSDTARFRAVSVPSTEGFLSLNQLCTSATNFCLSTLEKGCRISYSSEELPQHCSSCVCHFSSAKTQGLRSAGLLLVITVRLRIQQLAARRETGWSTQSSGTPYTRWMAPRGERTGPTSTSHKLFHSRCPCSVLQ